MTIDLSWSDGFRRDIEFGYLDAEAKGPNLHVPKLVLNRAGQTIEHAIVEELKRGGDFTFSVAFVTAGAIAQLKQHFREASGRGRIITSDFLGFNDPRAFAELLNLRMHFDVDVRRHTAKGFHPKGYVFERAESVTAMIGSSNLTNQALSMNHEWNLKVTAANESDLASQLRRLLEEQISDSEPLTEEWIQSYSADYVRRPVKDGQRISDEMSFRSHLEPNSMQRDALSALSRSRINGDRRAIIVSSTGTGKTMLAAFDVREARPSRMLFIAHREQILSRTIREFKQVLGGPDSDYGLLTGNSKQGDRRYVFASVQTLSQPPALASLQGDEFEYVIIDEAHRSAARTYQAVIDRLNPKFLLGMTATPERMDGYNVYELFDYNVPYEIRLAAALQADMLAPFHYYGISDVVYDDGTTTTAESPLRLLITSERVTHLINAMEMYGQAGVEPCGLIFCSRRDEAKALSDALNAEQFRGRLLKTVALTGEDSVERREQCVRDLQSGRLDYILTVDIFNEGIDIPSVNQVVMLRQTESAIVFVQQIGRGLRRVDGKDHLIVIDFIGNYTNNFLIPIALFGDSSLNRESLRQRLNESFEAGALPGLSSVSFDRISRDRILESIRQTRLDSNANLEAALLAVKNRLGRVPDLWDFYRFDSVDPVLLATRLDHYPAFVQAKLKIKSNLTGSEWEALRLISNEVLTAKQIHEFLLLETLMERNSVTLDDVREAIRLQGFVSSDVQIGAALDTLTLRGYSQGDRERYGVGIAEIDGDQVSLRKEFRAAVDSQGAFQRAVRDTIKTGKQLVLDRYPSGRRFTPGMQYSRRDAARLLGWPRSATSTIYGLKTDEDLGVSAIFVTLHKSNDVAASTAYEDELIDPQTMIWFSKSNRTLRSKDVRGLVAGTVEIHVFVKKDDADGSDHYYLGQATAHDGRETSMPGNEGQNLPVATMLLRFAEPISQGLFDYLTSAS